MTNRSAEVARTTRETSIELRIDLDGTGESRVDTPVGFLSHMLEAFSRHGAVDLDVKAEGDVHVDYHHTVEDVALVLGQAVLEALGDKRGIRRFGSAYVPMDESLARSVIDFSGRPYAVFEAEVDREMLLIHKDFPFALVEEFFKAFASAAKCNLHIDLVRGKNGHHAAEAIFKATALALRMAKGRSSEGTIPSTKGVL
ncbi:MAG: imidazoleglycerol-phosphate dehydratase HisB [Thermoanaerobaculia bacterium]|nr:imidazoleglycerol-phosphate dehydratase HisB [Thermoanaerobaculia bacterium]